MSLFIHLQHCKMSCFSNIFLQDFPDLCSCVRREKAFLESLLSSRKFISVSSMNPNEAETCHIYFTMRLVGKLSRENETIIFQETRAELNINK